MPPSVRQELQTCLDRGKPYLAEVLQANNSGLIVEFTLSSDEQQRLPGYPHKLNLGEREALALVEARQATLLTNDKRALVYCQQQHIRVVSLVAMLRLLWTRRLATEDEVRAIISQMQASENLTLTPAQQTAVFAAVRHR